MRREVNCRATSGSLRWPALAGFLALVLLARGAGADDWRQFRKDGRRSGAAGDATVLPMVEVWSHASRSIAPELTKARFLSMSTAVAAEGRVYFISKEPSPRDNLPYRTLIAADARTGDALWRAYLADLNRPESDTPEPGPALLDGGVAAYDRAPAGGAPQFGIRVLRERDGLPLAFWPLAQSALAAAAAGGGIPQFVLLQGHGAVDRMVPQPPDPTLPGELRGQPLVVGDEVLAAGEDDLLFRAAPLRPQPGTPVNWSFRIAHPVTAVRFAARSGLLGQMNRFPGAHLAGYPIAQAVRKRRRYSSSGSRSR